MSGGGVGLVKRPNTKPAQASEAATASGAARLLRRKRGSHAAQKRRLVQARQRARRTRSPHSQQKFGLYTPKSPSGENAVRSAFGVAVGD
jgi:hypothetical protein